MHTDEDLPANVPSHGLAETSQAPITPIQGPITQSRARKLQQEVNYLLTKFDYNTNENFILPKRSTFVLLRFTHIGAAAGPKETSYTEKETSYRLLRSEPCSKRHTHKLVKIHHA
uniref:Uncharacterized protein n=1 Tax=Setaria italica TaxID=4555 RepID=K3XT60_SETIT